MIRWPLLFKANSSGLIRNKRKEVNMSNWKRNILAAVLMLMLALALAACGGNGAPEGTYVVEGEEDSGVTVTFTGNNFRIEVPYAEIDLGYELPGYFAISGTFTVDNDISAVVLHVDENALRTTVSDMIDELLESVLYELGDLMDDPELGDILRASIDEMKDEMFDNLFYELLDEFTDFGFRFDGDFDRLYDDVDNVVFVRQ